MQTLFRNAKILLPDATVIDGCLGVSNERIAFVGEQDLSFKADRIIDCNKDILMPGFVNTHTHLPMTLFRSMGDDMPLHDWLQNRIWPLEDKLDADMCFWGSQLSAAEMIRGGVTACNDMYFFTEQILEAISLSGMRALIGRAIIDQDLEKRIDEIRSLHANWHGANNDTIRMSIAPHAEYTCSTDTMRRCREIQEELKLKFHIHVSETYDEHEACKDRHDGKTVVAWLDELDLINPDSLLAHCTHIELDDMAKISAKGATVLHSPESNCKLGSGIAPVPVMLSYGCNVALSTDSAASNNNLNMLEEMRFAALIHNGVTGSPSSLSSSQALSMATYQGAKALGWQSGALIPGYLADIIRIDCSGAHMQPINNLAAHIVYSASSSDVSMTMVNGEILYENGEFLTLDYDQICSNITRIAEDLNG